MPSYEELCARGCVKSLIDVIEQLPLRVAARWPLVVDDSSTRMLVLWTLLRWERTFLMTCLEEMGVDVAELARQLDELLNEKQIGGGQSAGQPPAAAGLPAAGRSQMEPVLRGLLDQAEEEAHGLKAYYIGAEHLLLAIITTAGDPLHALLLRHDVTHDKLSGAILKVSGEILAAMDPEIPPRIARAARLGLPEGPRGARWDSRAAGVPRRFGMAVLMLITTMYAVLFAVMQLLDARPEVFIVVAVLATGVGLGQMLLFGGRYPRAASVWVGACLFPVEVLVLIIYTFYFSPSTEEPLMCCFLLLSPILGAGFGYLMGGLTAGVFLLIEMYQKRRGE